MGKMLGYIYTTGEKAYISIRKFRENKSLYWGNYMNFWQVSITPWCDSHGGVACRYSSLFPYKLGLWWDGSPFLQTIICKPICIIRPLQSPTNHMGKIFVCLKRQRLNFLALALKGMFLAQSAGQHPRNFWGCFCSAGPESLGKIDGKVNSSTYQHILAQNLLSPVKKLKSWPKAHMKINQDLDFLMENQHLGMAQAEPKYQSHQKPIMTYKEPYAENFFAICRNLNCSAKKSPQSRSIKVNETYSQRLDAIIKAKAASARYELRCVLTYVINLL